MSNLRRPLFVAAVVLATACDYEAPVDEDVVLPGSVVRGSVLAPAVDVDARAFVLLTDAANPPPPYGTGRPASFAAVLPEAFLPYQDGLRGARYALTDVPVGRFYLTGLLDLDGNFHPGVDVLAGASCGDYGGARVVGFEDRVPAPIEVPARTDVSGADVLLAQRFDTPRPAFTFTSGVLGPFVAFEVEAVGVAGSFGEGLGVTIPPPGGECAASFTFLRPDADLDGEVDPHPELAAFEDTFPRVFLQWLGAPVDEDGDGVTDRYDRGDVPATTLIAGIGTPALVDAEPPPPNVPVITNRLVVTFPGFAQVRAPGVETELLTPGALPAGDWSVTLINHAGQTWTVPNELGGAAAAALLPPPGLTSARDPGQARVMVSDDAG